MCVLARRACERQPPTPAATTAPAEGRRASRSAAPACALAPLRTGRCCWAGTLRSGGGCWRRRRTSWTAACDPTGRGRAARGRVIMYGVCNNKANVCVCVCACVKSHVQAEMGRRIDSLLSDVIFTAPMKEYALQIGFVSVFRYSARLAPWTLTERLELNAMWSQAYTRFWCRRKSARGLDASPILSANDDGGRECPSVIKVWTREVLTVYKQCLFLPGEVSQIMKHHLYQPFLDHGCVSPSQLQQLLRVSGQTHFHSAIALLLLCLDEQGLKVSSRRAPLPGCLIADVIWPHWANYKLPGAPKKSGRGAANWTVHKRAARWRARGCGLRLMLQR